MQCLHVLSPEKVILSLINCFIQIFWEKYSSCVESFFQITAGNKSCQRKGEQNS